MTSSHPRDVNPRAFFLNKQHNDTTQSHGNRVRENETLRRLYRKAGCGAGAGGYTGTLGPSEALTSPWQLQEEALCCRGLRLQSPGAREPLRL